MAIYSYPKSLKRLGTKSEAVTRLRVVITGVTAIYRNYIFKVQLPPSMVRRILLTFSPDFDGEGQEGTTSPISRYYIVGTRKLNRKMPRTCSDTPPSILTSGPPKTRHGTSRPQIPGRRTRSSHERQPPPTRSGGGRT